MQAGPTARGGCRHEVHGRSFSSAGRAATPRERGRRRRRDGWQCRGGKSRDHVGQQDWSRPPGLSSALHIWGYDIPACARRPRNRYLPFGFFGLDNTWATGLLSKGAVGICDGLSTRFPACVPAADGPVQDRRHGDVVRTPGGCPDCRPTPRKTRFHEHIQHHGSAGYRAEESRCRADHAGPGPHCSAAGPG
ncbi:protein of unknown function [Streptomyces sp. KY75]|nr:protein of unknown function [Streptomyces sp. KY75]CAD5994808.1 protein of unknown function [Streptomyces sp. KY70]